MEIALLSIYLVTWIIFNIILLKSGMITNVPPLTPIGNLSPADAAEIAPAMRLRADLFGLISGNVARELIRLSWRVIPSNKYNIFFQILILTAFLLLIFLGPHIQALNEAEKKTRKAFEKMADDTANETEKIANDDAYVANETGNAIANEAEKIGNNVFKQPWLDAMSARNRYYIFCFIMLSFTPFFYVFFSFWFSPNPPFHPADPLTSLVVHNQILLFDSFLLHLTAGFNGTILFLYTVFSKKSWYFYFVPLVYAIAFYIAETPNIAAPAFAAVAPVFAPLAPAFAPLTNAFAALGPAFAASFRNYLISLILLIWPFFYLSKASIKWSMPFLILVPALFLT